MSKLTVAVLAVVIASIIIESEACPGLFGGGGCCHAPPPPPCGCGGRKKREVIQPQIKTQESDPCPQKEWQTIMEQNMGEDVTSSSYAIQGALYKTYNSKFFVTCAEKSKVDAAVFVANGEGYCNFSKGDILCQALALFG